MSERITKADLARLFQSFTTAAESAGFRGTEHWQMSTGSKTNGIAYRVYAVIPPSTGHSNLPHGLTNSSGYLGMTAREAWDELQTMRRVLWAVAEIKGDR